MLKPTVIDLFCGAGGFSLGFSAAGFHISTAVDTDENAAATFKKNFEEIQDDSPEVITGEEGDLNKINISELWDSDSEPDVLIAGPPCQGFSTIGQGKAIDRVVEKEVEKEATEKPLTKEEKEERKKEIKLNLSKEFQKKAYETDERNSLYLCMLKVAKELKPKIVVMENVRGMQKVAGVRLAEAAAADLANQGYRVWHGVLNAVWYGVPQLRQRFFMIGLREDLNIDPSILPIPLPTHLSHEDKGQGQKELFTETAEQHSKNIFEFTVNFAKAKEPQTTVEDAIGDLPVMDEHLSGKKQNTSFPTGRKNLPYRSVSEINQYVQTMKNWPGLKEKLELDDHMYRTNKRDYETFKRMKHNHRYPEALEIANKRLDEKIHELGNRGDLIKKYYEEYKQMVETEGVKGIDKKLSGLGNTGQIIEKHTKYYINIKDKIVPPYPADKFLDKWRKLSPDKPSWTILAHLAKDGYSHIHYSEDQGRTISVREAARLQSFPDAFEFVGSMGDCFRQIGNAVPPLMAKAIAEQLLEILKKV